MRRPLLLTLTLGLLMLTGCQVQTTVDIRTQTNGSGSITVQSELDPAAAAADTNLATQLSDADLTQAGWTITGPEREPNGDTLVKVRHSFVTPEQATQLMDQLTGTNGAFKDFKLQQTRSLSSVKTQFSGSADLSNGVQSFGALGFDVNELQTATGQNLDQMFPVAIEFHAPGTKSATPALNPDGSWHLQYGSVVALHATASGANTKAIAMAAIAAGLVLAAIALAIFWRAYVPRHREGGMSSSDFVTKFRDFDDEF